MRRALWLETIWLAIIIGRHVFVGGEDGVLYALAAVAILALLIPDVRARAFAAMWGSLIRKNAAEAQSHAVSLIAILPWLVVFAIWMLGAAMGGERVGIFAVIFSWTLVGVIVDRFFTRRSRQLLEERLARWAVRRSAGEFEHHDAWRQIGRSVGRWWAGQSRVAGPKG